MKSRLTAVAVALTLTTLVLETSAARAKDLEPFLVVVHPDNPTRTLTSSQVSKIFLGKLPGEVWEWGPSYVAVDLDERSEIRLSFSEVIHGKQVSAVKSYWQRMIYSGRDVPPQELGSDAAVLAFVRAEPGAIGYVSAAAHLDPGIKVLEIIGDHEEVITGPELASQLAYAGGRDVAGGHGGGTSSTARTDTIVAEQGDVRLFLTGSCGPDGRRAMVENRNAYHTIRVKVESSLWVDGRFRSNAHSNHALEPHTEKSLGCTRLSKSTEKRFAIAEVSDAALHPSTPAAADMPLRDALTIAASGTCGNGRQGRWATLLNRHPWRQVFAVVEYVDRVDGRENRRFTKSVLLAPAADKRLGCTRDGKLAREFSIKRSEFR